MSDLQQLRDFVDRSEVKNDAYWRAVLSSDTRNIFPKHELAKIEIAKNRISKLRLVSDHLPHFLSLQLYANSRQHLAKTVPEKEITKELEQLAADIELCKSEPHSNDYQFEILEGKGKVEQLCAELGKSKIRPEVREQLQRSEKWKNYLNTHCKDVPQYEEYLNERDKVQLARVVALDAVDDCLNYNTAGKIIEKRVGEQVMKDRLAKIFDSEDLEVPEGAYS